MGRKKIEIDWAKVDEMLNSQCLGTDVANCLGVKPEMLYKACKRDKNMLFSEYSKMQNSNGKVSLRAKQFEIAMQGNVTMLIWLGKQYLDQREPERNQLQTFDNGLQDDIDVMLTEYLKSQNNKN